MAAQGTMESSQSGQAITEYILLLSLVVIAFLMVSRIFSTSGLAQKLTAPILQSYVSVYKYGATNVKGYDEGDPVNHPRVAEGATNFRLFLTTKKGGLN